jgi:hypothetical protein
MLCDQSCFSWTVFLFYALLHDSICECEIWGSVSGVAKIQVSWCVTLHCWASGSWHLLKPEDDDGIMILITSGTACSVTVGHPRRLESSVLVNTFSWYTLWPQEVSHTPCWWQLISSCEHNRLRALFIFMKLCLFVPRKSYNQERYYDFLEASITCVWWCLMETYICSYEDTCAPWRCSWLTGAKKIVTNTRVYFLCKTRIWFQDHMKCQ